MKLVRLEEIFDVRYGVNLELNKMYEMEDGIPFVSRTAKNNGVAAFVRQIEGIDPNPSDTISVAGGGSVMESFLQSRPYYSGRDLYYLKPKTDLSDNEMLYYCACLRENKYRFNYGRQANRTLKSLLVPAISEIPGFVYNASLKLFTGMDSPVVSRKISFSIAKWRWFRYDFLFDIARGRGPRKKDLDGSGKVPFVTSSDQNNGWTNFTIN